MERSATLRFLAAGALAGLAACVAPPPVPAPAPAPSPAADLGPGTPYEVVGSDLAIEVYRDGSLAELGHNHVIGSRALAGQLVLRNPRSDSSFALTLPVAELTVDEAARREAAGTEFPDNLSAEDKEGTRRNMLSPALLDAGRFPLIELQAAGIDGGGGRLLARTRVTVAGRTSEIVVPVSLELDGEQLRASGAFTLTHSQLGLKPFSALLGALKVREDMRVAWRLEARRAPGTS